MTMMQIESRAPGTDLVPIRRPAAAPGPARRHRGAYPAAAAGAILLSGAGVPLRLAGYPLHSSTGLLLFALAVVGAFVFVTGLALITRPGTRENR